MASAPLIVLSLLALHNPAAAVAQAQEGEPSAAPPALRGAATAGAHAPEAEAFAAPLGLDPPGAPGAHAPEGEPSLDPGARLDAGEQAARHATLASPIQPRRLANFLILGVPLTWLTSTAAGVLAGGAAFAGLGVATSGQSLDELARVSFALGLAISVGVTYLMLPALMKLMGDDEGHQGSIEAAGQRAWALARWFVLAGALGLVMATAGSAFREDKLLLAGGITTLSAYLLYWTFDVYGVVEGYQRSRRPRG